MCLGPSYPLDHGRQPLADADAEGGDSVPRLAPPELPRERGHEPGAGAAQRVAERDGAAVDVEAVLVDAELARAGEDLSGERLVDLDQVDLIEGEAGGVEGAADGRTGPIPMNAGSTPATPWATMRASGWASSRPAAASVADDDAGGAVVERRGVAAVTVPPSRNAGRSAASLSSVVSSRGPSSRVDHGLLAALRGRDRDHLLGEPALALRRDRPLVAAQREGVLVGA